MSIPAIQEAVRTVMTTQPKAWTAHERGRKPPKGGKTRASLRIGRVARAQGNQAKIEVTNSRTQAWCMPCRRMTNTVSTALPKPKANQHRATDHHGTMPRLFRVLSILKS